MANFNIRGRCIDCGHDFHLYPMRTTPDNYNGGCAYCGSSGQIKVILVSKTLGANVPGPHKGLFDFEEWEGEPI